MDDQQFDDLARSLIHSRRALLGLGVALGVAPPRADAKKRKRKRRKKIPPCQPECAGRTCGSDGCGGVCGQCGAGQTCSGGACEPLVCGNGGACHVFVSSTTHQGDLFNGQSSGLLGADSICQQRADSAGLPGSYMAWLSDFADSPATRFRRSPGPYQLVDGMRIAGSWNDLTDGSLANGIHVDERGTAVPSSPLQRVWTNTNPDGTQSSSDRYLHCGSWGTGSDIMDGRAVFGLTGLASETLTNAIFTGAGDRRCNEFNRLYCFQQS